MRACTRNWLKIDNELAFRIAIAGMKSFTETGTSLD
ncbi:UNVERIFIED_ORG: hypothetical protein M2154_002510 [Enterobacter sp. JUb101]|nr:hypothetical protein [Lelliottia amnigena]